MPSVARAAIPPRPAAPAWAQAPSVPPPPPSAALDPVADVTGDVVVRATPASLPRRSLAAVVDLAVIAGILALYLYLAALVVGHPQAPTELTGLDALMSTAHRLERVLVPGAALGVVLGLVYSAVFAVIWEGRTPGRWLAGIRLVDRTGLPPTPMRASVRAAMALASFLVGLGGFWVALFDRKGQTLHDKLTRTFVVRPG